MRAVVEFHRDKMELPKLKIIVAKGQQDLTIKVFQGAKQRKQTDITFLYNWNVYGQSR